MRAICVDDERALMERTVALCRELPDMEEVTGFTRPAEALAWVSENPVDFALLDVEMPGMTGIELAAAIKERRPDVAVIFVTAYPKYAVDAFAVRASGYLLKPVTLEALTADVQHAMSGRHRPLTGHVVVRTFGAFDIYVNGNLVEFKLSKSKEILAFLVDRQGGTVTRPELFAALWEDRVYDRGMQKQLDNYIRVLRTNLREQGIEDILEIGRGTLRVRPERFVCDLYLFLEGDRDAAQSYRGEYMTAYSWANMTEGLLTWRKNGGGSHDKL
ncbi:MAG: response regulator [Clostridia bacterium]|nr:response regulator [Clostridia bacterium]